MINNPAQWFVTGNDQKEFTYEGGAVLYNFQPADCGLSTSRELNVLFFADSEKHAKAVIKRMLKFALGCSKEYQAYGEATKGHKFYSRHAYLEKSYEHLLANQDKWVVSLAPTDQVFNVSWACNDTF